MSGVTDFSIFEQEGADCSALTVIQAEATAGRLRFWFDPQGELYVVCEEAVFEEVSAPIAEFGPGQELARWTFQSEAAESPSVDRLLAALDRAGIPAPGALRSRIVECIRPSNALEISFPVGMRASHRPIMCG